MDLPRGKWITYEEVINDSRPVHYETVLGTRVATRAPESQGKHNIRMIEINKKIQDVIKKIIAKEFEEDTIQTKIHEVQDRSFDSHLSAITKITHCLYGIPCAK